MAEERTIIATSEVRKFTTGPDVVETPPPDPEPEPTPKKPGKGHGWGKGGKK